MLDSAVTDHVALVAQLEQVLHARVHDVIVQRLDMVNETTMVDVRYAVARERGGRHEQVARARGTPMSAPPLARLAPIAVAEMVDRAAFQSRVDRKYVVPVEELPHLLEQLTSRARVLDIDGERSFRYKSVYFDTPCWPATTAPRTGSASATRYGPGPISTRTSAGWK